MSCNKQFTVALGSRLPAVKRQSEASTGSASSLWIALRCVCNIVTARCTYYQSKEREFMYMISL